MFLLSLPDASVAHASYSTVHSLPIAGHPPTSHFRTTQVDVVVFDKTGTLTAGKPQVTAVTPVAGSGMEAAAVLRLAAVVESNTTHPVAQVREGGGEMTWHVDGELWKV